ncbi:hypothetical protein JCM14635_05200 [Megalodesulfovibrio paquesii]
MPALELYPYQRQWIGDKSRFKIGMLARQTGKTFTTTLEIVDDCLEAASQGWRERWVILSRGERQAKEAIDEGVKPHAKAYGAAFESLEYEWKDEATYKALEVVLPGGSRITALPANPNTARGFSANVFLDEFGFHQDSKAIWKALFPVISKPGLKLRVTSTPNGKDNKFYELMTGESRVWSRHVVDIHRAVADGLPRDIAELREGLDDEDAWAQEYELKWLDEASAWLSYDLINSVEHDAAGEPDHYQGGPCYIGVDIGRAQGPVRHLGPGAGGRRLLGARAHHAAAGDLQGTGCPAGRVPSTSTPWSGAAWTRPAWAKSPWKTPRTPTASTAWKACSLPGRPSSTWPPWARKPFRTAGCASPRATRAFGGTCIPSRKSRRPWARRGFSPRGMPIPTPTGPGRSSLALYAGGTAAERFAYQAVRQGAHASSDQALDAVRRLVKAGAGWCRGRF